MAVGVFIEYDGQIVQFPVNPEEVELTGASGNNSVEIIRTGEITELGIRKLKELSFSSFFPANRNEGSFIQTKNRFWTPTQYIQFIERIRNERQPCHFVITGTTINMTVSIEGFDYRHQAGNTADVYFTLDLKEFRPYDMRVVSFDGGTINSFRSSQSNQLSVGDIVLVNGGARLNGYSDSVARTEKNSRRRIAMIDDRARFPILVADLGDTTRNGWVGWLDRGSVRKA